jgi:predicted ATPase
VLDPLDPAEAGELAARLADPDLGGPVLEGLVRRAEGNPLFLAQLVAHHADGATESLPPTVDALLAARLDRLEAGEWAVLAAAAVVGRRFSAAALAALLPDAERDRLATRLTSLVRRQLVEPEEAAFRFGHALVRDAAYEAVPKRDRAELHERAAALVDEDEVVAHHLENVLRYRAELGAPADPVLAARAVACLQAAARTVVSHGHVAGAALLLERAVALLDAFDPARAALLLELGEALQEAGRLADATAILAEAAERAAATRDERLVARAHVAQELVRLHASAGSGLGEAHAVADAALAVLRGRGDDLGRCQALSLRAWVAWNVGRAGEAATAWEQAAEHAGRAGDRRRRFELLGWYASAAFFGSTPVEEAIRRCSEIRDEVQGSPVAEAVVLHPLGSLHAMAGDVEQGRALIAAANEILGELGRLHSAVSHHEATLEMLAGRHAAAEERLRGGYARLEEMGDTALLATTAALLARTVQAQGRDVEAEELTSKSEAIAAPEDLVTQVLWRSVRARVLARRGAAGEAEALAREAVRLAEPTDLLILRADALSDLAEVLALNGAQTGAAAAGAQALRLYEEKGDVLSASRTRGWLARSDNPVGE